MSNIWASVLELEIRSLRAAGRQICFELLQGEESFWLRF
jgi:hypothetical protein